TRRGGYRLRAKKVKIHQLRAVESWDIHWVYINYAQRLLSTFSRLILIARSGHLVSTLMLPQISESDATFPPEIWASDTITSILNIWHVLIRVLKHDK
ncbi:hypothetical protein C0J52_12097, partial [Blattella germanica]